MIMSYDTQLVNKNDIQVGDIIVCKDGKIRTVCRNNITNDSFMGLCLFGDSYHLGREPVTKVMNLKEG